MFKKISAALLAMMMCIPLAGCSLTKTEPVEVTVETEVPPRMLFLGDSIAAGYGLDGYSESNLYSCDSYANILAEKYSSELEEICENDMTNLSVSGDDSSELITLINSGKIDDALENTDAVIVSIGGNDILWILTNVISEIGFSFEEHKLDLGNLNILAAASALLNMNDDIDKALDSFDRNLEEIADLLNEKTDAPIFVQTLYNPIEYFSWIDEIQDFSDSKIDRFNEIVEKNAQGKYTVVDVAAEFRGKSSKLTNMKSFDIHPNHEGHEVIAGAVDKALRTQSYSVNVMREGEPHLTALAYILIISAILLSGGATAYLILRSKKF